MPGFRDVRERGRAAPEARTASPVRDSPGVRWAAAVRGPALAERAARGVATVRAAPGRRGRTAPVGCGRPHTAQTYFVGRLDLTTKAGHVRRPDSRAAQRQARGACTSRLPRHLGRTPVQLRLSMAQAVWFTPSPTRAEGGADWFRCDVVVVASPRQLMRLPRRTKGWGETPAIGMCATAAPGTEAFRRVTCGAPAP